MKLMEFVDKYCSDLVEHYQEKNKALELDDLPYDDIIEDDTGEKIKVVYAGQKAIPVMDIISSTREDFAVLYPDFESRELYDRYIEQLVFWDGEEAVRHIQLMMRREQERVKAFNEDNSLADNI